MRRGITSVLGSLKSGVMTRVYENTLTSAVTSITISGLDGNAHGEYRLIVRRINGGDGAGYPVLRFNGDSGSNYGHQFLYCNDAAGTVLSAIRFDGTYLYLSYSASVSPNSDFLDIVINAKSGFVRTLICNYLYIQSGTAYGSGILGGSWNNTADNITSMLVGGSNTNGLGVGTSIELYRSLEPS